MDTSESEGDYEMEERKMDDLREIYKQKTITWEEMYKVLKLWIEYGDDSFEDEYAELYEIEKHTTDPSHKKNLKTMLKIMNFLREKCYHEFL